MIDRMEEIEEDVDDAEILDEITTRSRGELKHRPVKFILIIEHLWKKSDLCFILVKNAKSFFWKLS